MESNKLKSKAYQNPETANPSINLSPIRMITALITSKKSPSVIKVTGIVRKTRIGFKNVFNKANTTATMSAVVKLSTAIPGRK
jgi:hypothetical protein